MLLGAFTPVLATGPAPSGESQCLAGRRHCPLGCPRSCPVPPLPLDKPSWGVLAPEGPNTLLTLPRILHAFTNCGPLCGTEMICGPLQTEVTASSNVADSRPGQGPSLLDGASFPPGICLGLLCPSGKTICSKNPISDQMLPTPPLGMSDALPCPQHGSWQVSSAGTPSPHRPPLPPLCSPTAQAGFRVCESSFPCGNNVFTALTTWPWFSSAAVSTDVSPPEQRPRGLFAQRGLCVQIGFSDCSGESHVLGPT